MSKFFRGGQSSSESSDSEASDDVPVARQPAKGKINFLSESEDDSPKRIVRASKDKVYDELKENVKVSRNAEKIKDLSKLLQGIFRIFKIYFNREWFFQSLKLLPNPMIKLKQL